MQLACLFIQMSDSQYTTGGVFLEIVDSNWVLDTLPFEDIQVNIDILPTSEPELGTALDPNQQNSLEKITRVEYDLQPLLLPRNPSRSHLLSARNLPRL
ncbi:hypothetical protein TSMEX_004270 [Taenia solium]